MRINFDSDDEEDNEEEEDENVIESNKIINDDINKMEGYLYKFIDGKMKKLWFKLVNKDLYYYKNKFDVEHKGIHNLSGLFLEEIGSKIINGKRI